MEKKPVGFKNYKDFRHEFETELVYTRQELALFLEEKEKQMLVNRVIQIGKDFNVAMKIVRIDKTDNGLIIYVT